MTGAESMVQGLLRRSDESHEVSAALEIKTYRCSLDEPCLVIDLRDVAVRCGARIYATRA